MFTTILKEDLAFWGIDELSLQACCSLKYYSQISSCQSELEEERNKRYGFCLGGYLFCHSFSNISLRALKLFSLFIIHDNDLDNNPYCVNYWFIRDAEDQRNRDEDFGESLVGKIRKTLWNFLEYPETSIAAQALAFLSLLMVCVSTVTFIIGTNSEGEREKRQRLADGEKNVGEIMDENGVNAQPSNLNITEVIDNIAVIFFGLEYFMRKVDKFY